MAHSISEGVKSEYLGTLKRAFTGPKAADYVTIDGWTNGYIAQCTDWALGQGYIVFDKKTSDLNSDSQYTALCYRLTDLGKEVIK